MIHLNTFLGFPIDPLFEKHLQKTNHHLVMLFTAGGNYLEKIFFQNKDYLGKFMSPLPLIEEVECLQANILSLLRKLVPHYPIKENPLFFLPLLKDGQ
jgi:hypothetical protein